MNILIVNADLPVFPGWGGIEFLNTTQLAAHADHLGLVSAVHSPEQESKLGGLTDAGVHLYLWRSPALTAADRAGDPAAAKRRGLRERAAGGLHHLNQLRHALMPPTLSQPTDTHGRSFDFRNLAPFIAQAMSERTWQVLIVVQSTCAHWLDALPVFPVSVLVMHDARALVYERESRTASTAWRRWTAALEAKRYRRFERHYCQTFDHVIAVSDTDEAWIRKTYQPHRLTTLPIPLDTHYFKPTAPQNEMHNRIMFTGTMNHPPNVDAVLFFVQEVLPLVLREIPEAEFRIVGRSPNSEILALDRLPHVTVTGFVDDIRTEIATAAVMVVPIRFGAGMRQKILEAWSMQKCVISTSIGAEGISYTHDRDILIADDREAMARAVVTCLRENETRAKLKTGGIAIVKAQHDPIATGRRFFEAISETLKEKQRETDRPIHSLVDLRWMIPGEAGGIENLARSFVKQLFLINPADRFTLLVPSEVKYDFTSPQHPTINTASLDGLWTKTKVWFRRGIRLSRALLRVDYWQSAAVEQLQLTARYDADVVLSIPGYIHPDFRPLSNLLIMTDLQHVYFPLFFTDHEVEERERLYTDSVLCADHICAISEFTRQSMLEHWHLDPDNVSTVHLAADPIFHTGSPQRRDTEKVRSQYGLVDTPYIFFPGNTWPHKNHEAALHALQILGERHGWRPLLVCTGAKKNAHDRLNRLADSLGITPQLRFLGHCPATDLPALYEGARALVFPSLFEGFGMPVLEAMWCECPVVCSNSSSLPEVAGNAALMVDPQDHEGLAEALYRVHTSAETRNTLIRAGLIQARKFSWEHFTLEILKQMHAVQRKRYDIRDDANGN
ncbi:MAG: glycosyltransferase [Lentisphaerae bacterium]|nr:glycosyltransferase [Lentisphaerota bacterium]